MQSNTTINLDHHRRQAFTTKNNQYKQYHSLSDFIRQKIDEFILDQETINDSIASAYNKGYDDGVLAMRAKLEKLI